MARTLLDDLTDRGARGNKYVTVSGQEYTFMTLRRNKQAVDLMASMGGATAALDLATHLEDEYIGINPGVRGC